MASQNSNDQYSPNIDLTSPYTPRRPAPIISLSVNHPVGKAIRKIKNFLVHKQTLFQTSFTIKVTPIVAIVSLFGVATLFGGGLTTAYHFGKTVEEKFLLSPTPKPIKPPKQTPLRQGPSTVSSGRIGSAGQANSNGFVLINNISPLNTISKAGTLQATYQQIPHLNPLPTSSSLSALINHPTPTSTVLNYILTSRNGSVIYLKNTGSFSFADYLNQKVLVTGSYDSSKNTITVQKPEDIEIL